MFKHRQNQAELITGKPFIFLESKTDVGKEAYIEWAASKLKKEGEEVHVFDVPYAYKFDILDAHRKKLVTTGYASSQNGGSHMFSIFQLDKKQHLICTYHFDVEDLDKDFLSVVLLSNKPSNFLDFIKGHKDFEETLESSKRLGFG